MPTRPASPCDVTTCPETKPCSRHTARQPKVSNWQRHNANLSSTARGYGYGWKKLRKQVLEESPYCELCGAVATDVDHRLAKAKGGTDDRSNLRSLCHPCHQRKADGGRRAALNAHYAPKFAIPVTVVCGPPGSGKSTYVAERAKDGDLIIDIDAIYMALSSQPMYDKPQALLPFVMEARDAVLKRLTRPSDVRHAWVITSAPTLRDRDVYTTAGATVVVCETSPAECLRRISQDERRASRWQLWETLVNDWWRAYEREGVA